jgi:DNA polymerase III subunit epsilon
MPDVLAVCQNRIIFAYDIVCQRNSILPLKCSRLTTHRAYSYHLRIMPLELKRPIIFFDIESTGLDVANDRIIELAVIKIFPDGRRQEKCRRFNPMIPIPKDATAIHGITDDDVKNDPPFYKVAGGEKGIGAFFDGCDLAGYNIINFDIPLLKTELGRADLTLDLSTIAVVDVLKIFTTREKRDLTAAVKFYCDKDFTQAHSALADVLATYEVLEGQMERYPDLPQTPEEIDKNTRLEGAIDLQGKLRWQDGEVAIGFGKHKGHTLKELATDTPNYIRWMIDKEVIPDAANILHDALLGVFPEAEKD